MKKIFITTLLFLLSLCVLAFTPAQMKQLTAKNHINLGYKMPQPDPKLLIWDFKHMDGHARMDRYSWDEVAYVATPGTLDLLNTWYHLDFPQEPFDGRIQVLTAGAPLPPASTTLIVAFVTAGIIVWSRRQPVRN